ncbi:MAG: hypothetical protein L0Z55_07100 [Planctomycetes bacterium]|nr:hypothetical protein [Planctomycetota bacterium]
MQIAFAASLLLLPVLYTLLISGYGRLFAGTPSGVARIARPLLAATVGLHFVSMLLRGLQLGACPLASRWEFVSLVALSIAVTYLLIEIRIGDQRTGIFVITLAFLLQFAASVFMPRGDSAAAAARLGAMPSVFLVALIVGYSAVAVSCIYGILYLFLYGAIKRGRFGLFFRKAPPLATLASQNHHAAVAAFMALGAALAAGAIAMWGSEAGVPEAVAREFAEASAVWLAFGAVLGAWRWFDLGAKRLAVSSVAGAGLAAALHLATILNEAFHG